MSWQGLAFLLASGLLYAVAIFYLSPALSRAWFWLKLWRISSRVATEILLAREEKGPSGFALRERQSFTVCLKAKAYGAVNGDIRCDAALGELAKALALEFGFQRGVTHYQGENVLFVFYGHPEKQP